MLWGALSPAEMIEKRLLSTYDLNGTCRHPYHFPLASCKNCKVYRQIFTNQCRQVWIAFSSFFGQEFSYALSELAEFGTNTRDAGNLRHKFLAVRRPMDLAEELAGVL